MPNSARRVRERADTRERIIAAALGVLESDGATALTMRRIAADIEYTAPIVYQHFANKDALLQELVLHGFRLLAADLQGAPAPPDVDLRMLQAAAEYVGFAGRHPHLYAAMNDTTIGGEERRAAAEPVYALLSDLLRAWSEDHDVDLGDHADACEIVWGTLHGVASIGYLDTVGNDRAQRLAARALGAILAGWRSEAPGTPAG